MLGELLRRVGRLHRLLWLDDRIGAVEARLDALNAHLDARLDRLDAQLEMRLGRTREQLDLLKSSLEVPDALIDEFFEWRMRNPIPERPLVTVAVATYNRAELLTKRCIPSVLDQTYANLELIVVGDGCTDGTAEAVARIGDPRLRFRNLPSRDAYPEDPDRRWRVAGTAPTREALSMARGYFITHLDDDDEYLPGRLERLVEFARSNDCDFVWHPFWQEDEDGGWTLREARDFGLGQLTNLSVFYRSWFKRIEPDIHAHRLREPGDWNRFRRIKYIDPVCMRYPEPLSRHYRERSRDA